MQGQRLPGTIPQNSRWGQFALKWGAAKAGTIEDALEVTLSESYRR